MWKTVSRKKRVLALIVSLGAVGVHAAEEPQAQSDNKSGTPISVDRFGPYRDNYAIYNVMRNDGWARDDEAAIRAHYSFKFTFCGPQFKGKESTTGKPKPRFPTICPEGEKSSQVELFAAYAGEFDFYLGTRDSGPVINRMSNPGLYARVPLHLFLPSANLNDDVEIGFEHRSNGQVTEVTAPREAERAQAAYVAGDRFYFDTVSRGANFVSVATRTYDLFGNDRLELHSKLRLYVNQDSRVTWGPLANSSRKFSDYDRLQLTTAYHSPVWGRWELEWRLGDRGLKTDSFTAGWQVDSDKFPLYVRLHHGPFNTLSNYTQRQDSIGIGLRFASR